MKKTEYRGVQGLEVREDSSGEGIFSGYIAIWGTVDSYNSSFTKGSFKKTISERGTRIKILDNHNQDKLIGKITEIREDDKGVYVEGQLTMAVEKARDVFEHIRASVLDTLSFGFSTISDKWVQGVRQITEVKLFEVSPVNFEANEAAMIESLRKEKIEERADTIEVTLLEKELNYGGQKLQSALEITLDDIWWMNDDADVIRAKTDEAIADFHGRYLEWLNKYLAYYWEGETELRFKPCTNELRTAFASFADGRTLEAIAAETEFTVDELRTISQGKVLTPSGFGKVASLPEELRTVYNSQRRALVEELCAEIRTGGFTGAEGARFQALLFQPEKRSTTIIVEAPVINPLNILLDTIQKLGK